MPSCLICGTHVDAFLSFGKMPIANGFLTQEQLASEYFFDLEVGRCASCHMVQLTNLVDPGKLFHDQYAYFSSISTRMSEHFRGFAEWVRATYLGGPRDLVVEIGSNDGIMLRNFAAAGIPHLGVEPSANVAAAAQKAGVRTICSFFDEETARRIRAEHGPASAVLGANVICHIPDLHAVARALDILLDERGVFVFEDPYLGDILAKTSYDQIYDEHVFYFSLHSLSALFARHGMEVVDALPQEVHGGEVRFVVARRGARPVSEAVERLRQEELRMGLTSPEAFARFASRVESSRDALSSLLRDLRGRGKRVAGYGATSKSTTVINYCGIGPDLLEYISDTTPGKQGKLSPGAHIPVSPYERFRASPPDYALLFAWNHAQEILAKERGYAEAGGRFITYVPDVHEVGA